LELILLTKTKRVSEDAVQATPFNVEYHLFLEVVLCQELLNYLNHFLVSTGKAGASQAYSDLSFILFHD
jgi:hypothetical protein